MKTLFSLLVLTALSVSCSNTRQPASSNPEEERRLEELEFYRLQMGAEMGSEQTRD